MNHFLKSSLLLFLCLHPIILCALPMDEVAEECDEFFLENQTGVLQAPKTAAKTEILTTSQPLLSSNDQSLHQHLTTQIENDLQTIALANIANRLRSEVDNLPQNEVIETPELPSNLVSSTRLLSDEQQRHQERVHRYVWNYSFADWELPGELPENAPTHFAEDSESAPPATLQKEREELGRKLLKIARSGQQESALFNPTIALLINSTEQAKQEIQQASFDTTNVYKDQNNLRLAYRAEANRLYAEAAAIVQTRRDERTAQAEENQPVSEASEAHEKNSMLGTLFSSFSKVSSTVGAPQIKISNLEAIAAAAEAAETDWESLVKEAEKIRMENGGAAIHSDDVIDAWNEADQKTLQARKDKASAVRLAKNWKTNIARWKARASADYYSTQANLAEESVQNLRADSFTLHAKVNASKKEKQQAQEIVAMAAEELATRKTEADQAYKEWRALALNHRSGKATCGRGEAATEASLEKLKAADQAVNQLWNDIRNLYAEDEIKEPITSEAQAIRLQKEAESYQLKRALSLSRSGPNAQGIAEAVKQDALEAARKRIPGAIQYWITRANNSEQERLRQNSERNQTIAAADAKALATYQKEEQRLTDIETISIAIIEARKKDVQTAAKIAAKKFISDSTTHTSGWFELPLKERAAYNQSIEKANKIYKATAQAPLQLAEERMNQAQYEVDKRKYSVRNAVGISNRKQLAIEALEKAKKQLATQQVVEAERLQALRWPELTKKERNAELKIEKAKATFANAKKVWIPFSEAMQNFKNNPNEMNLIPFSEAMRNFNNDPNQIDLRIMATDLAVRPVYAAKDSFYDDNHVDDPLYYYPYANTNLIDPYPSTSAYADDLSWIVAPYKAAYEVFKPAYEILFYNKNSTLDASGSIANAAVAFTAANAARGTIWEEETQWVAQAIQEVVDFIKAVKKFRKWR